MLFSNGGGRAASVSRYSNPTRSHPPHHDKLQFRRTDACSWHCHPDSQPANGPCGFGLLFVFLLTLLPRIGGDIAHRGGGGSRQLCDSTNSGKLNAEQFALAMHIIAARVKGVPVPTALTPQMVPPGMRSQPVATAVAPAITPSPLPKRAPGKTFSCPALERELSGHVAAVWDVVLVLST